jgi:pimeloyl-ACP methyl ester carboxylesterase
MSDSVTVSIREEKNERALIFIHGFQGRADQTFGLFPAFVAGHPSLFKWDIFSFGYPTSLAPDITGVWSADPDLDALSVLLRTSLKLGQFQGYSKLAIIAHSMGGLVVQRALLDAGLNDRISHVLLFGTPSNGLWKAGLAKLFKRQARDMTKGGPFITKLRSDWTSGFGTAPPFRFLAVAGARDQFVPPESSVGPFDSTLQAFVDGNHLEMVKPERLGSDSALLVLNMLTGATVPLRTPAPGAPIGHASVRRAFEIESVEGTQKAIQFLQAIQSKDSDVKGTLAGRLKRLWLCDPVLHQADGNQALDLYRQSLEESEAAGDHEQAYYHAINCAFMTLALNASLEKAKEIAKTALEHCQQAAEGKWRQSTIGEASLYLGDDNASVAAYRRALTMDPDLREKQSMQQQAVWTARLLENENAELRLQGLFEGELQPDIKTASSS